MSDKIRGALFNSLGDIAGLHLLDAFAGSGAVGFEALSRGASRVMAIENDRLAQRSILESVAKLKLGGQYKLIKAGCASWHDTNPEVLFDIVIADPPYDSLQPVTLQAIAKHVRPYGLLVVSWPGGRELPVFEALDVIKNSTFGDAQLAFYRRN